MTLTITVRYRGGETETIVDGEDYEWLSRHSWNLGSAGYPTTKIGGRSCLMHRLVLRLVVGDGTIVDHINRAKLDNRRANLRVGDSCLSAQNRERPPGRTSRFRGVTLYHGRWRARATVRGKQFCLGSFATEEAAARAAADFRAEHMPFSQDALERKVAA